MGDSKLSPTLRRAFNKSKFCKEFALLIVQKSNFSAVARHFDVSDSLVHAWCNEGARNMFSVVDAMGLDEPLRLAVAQMIAGDDYAVSKLPHYDESTPELRAVNVAFRESTEALQATMDACEDGVVTREEGAAIVKQSTEALSAMQSLRAIGERAVRDGVYRLRRVG